jgi:hypothetical protein
MPLYTRTSRAEGEGGERRVSALRLACTLTLVRGSQIGSLPYAIFEPLLYNRFISSWYIQKTGT